MIHNPAAAAPKTSSGPFTVRTHNLGFVYDFMRIVGDLRDVKTRAAEIGHWLRTSPELPEVIVFQEGFHLDATGVLCEQLKEKYPYVIHNIAPHISGLNNGAIIASQHPIEELTYRPFDNMLGPEKWSTRGLIKVRIQRNGKPIDVYGTHLQALLGKERAAVRAQQIGQIAEWVKEDQRKNPASAAIVVGDMNASQVTAWGERSEEDAVFFEKAEKDFVDIFRNDHDELGKRTSGSPRYAQKDSPEGHHLEEPSGSWFVGPFADKGLIMSLKELYERVVHHVPVKTQAKKMPRPHHWGTPNWSAVQHACSARFDFIFRFKKSRFTGWFDRAEIRRVKVDPKVQSAPSDHAPLDARIRIGLL
jgi:endonuclease/exonuclease/phosphatase family metal-dependent hydrolase